MLARLFLTNDAGSGHHGLVPMFRELPGVVLIASTEQMLTNLWDPTVSIAERERLRTGIIHAVQNKFDQCVNTATAPVEQNCSHFILFGRANFFRYTRFFVFQDLAIHVVTDICTMQPVTGFGLTDTCIVYVCVVRHNAIGDSCSYPYDSPRSPLRHPDLLELIDILGDPTLSVTFDIKILVLHREPYKTVQSNLRRG